MVKKSITATSRTLEYLRRQGWAADIVERFNAHAGKFGIHQDLFGIIDIIALGENGIYGIQSCGTSFSEHKKKMLSNPRSLEWIDHGGILMLIGWRKILKNRGGKLKVWTPRIHEFSEEEF